MNGDPSINELTRGIRIISAAAGFIAIVGALLLFFYYQPPVQKITEEKDAVAGNTKSTTTEYRDVIAPFAAMLVGGIALGFFALNGVRLSKLSVGGISIEAFEKEKKAKETAVQLLLEERVQRETEKRQPATQEERERIVEASAASILGAVPWSSTIPIRYGEAAGKTLGDLSKPFEKAR